MYFSNSQPSRDLPTPAGPEASTRRGTRRSTAAWNSSLIVRSSASRPVSGRLQPVDPLRAAHRRQDPGGPPQPLRLGLALQLVLAGAGEPDGAAGQPLRGLVRQHLPRAGRGLHPGRGVHRVPGHHALADRAQVDRHLAGYHARAGGQARQAGLGPERLNRGHQVQRGPDGPFGVRIRRGRSPPHRHYRVPDELLDGPAVTADDCPRHPEVAGQQLTDRLGIPRLGQRGKAHQVTEQHRAHPPFGHRLAAWRRGVPGRRASGPARNRRPGRNGRRERTVHHTPGSPPGVHRRLRRTGLPPPETRRIARISPEPLT